jgi:hypothetical protein
MRENIGNRTETRTNLQIINEAGTISWPGGSSIDVTFNLIELQDFTDGVPGRKYSYGNLSFRDRLESSIVLLFLSRTRLVLTGGGIQTAVCLYGINSFTVMGAILELAAQNLEVAA